MDSWKENRMNDFLKFIAVGIVLWLFALWLNESDAAEDIKEFYMKSETGEVVLTKEPCEFIKMGLKNYPYAAYATEVGHANHEGCWRMDNVNGMRSVLIYFPEIDATGVYNPELFQPRQKNNVYLEPKFEFNKAMVYGVYTF
jgi:hypothetical protein